MTRGAKKKAMNTEIQKLGVMRDARQRRHLTMFVLAQRVGTSESQICRIETGRGTPQNWLKEAIARELNIQTWQVGP